MLFLLPPAWELTRSGRWDCDGIGGEPHEDRGGFTSVGIDQIRTVGLRPGPQLGEIPENPNLRWELTRSGRWDCDSERIAALHRDAAERVGIDQIRTVGLRLEKGAAGPRHGPPAVGIDQIRTVGLRRSLTRLIALALMGGWELTRSGRWDCDYGDFEQRVRLRRCGN